MKKRDVGMAKHFSKKYGNKGWAFDYPVSAIWNKFLFCQDACQCLMLHPYITASRTIIILSWIRAFNIKSTLQKRGCKVYVISFLYSKCSTYKAAWVCGQSYGSISHNPTKCALDPYSWKNLILATCFWGSDVGM